MTDPKFDPNDTPLRAMPADIGPFDDEDERPDDAPLDDGDDELDDTTAGSDDE